MALSTPYTYQTGDQGSGEMDSSSKRSTPILVEDFDKGGHELSRVDLQRLKSSLHCAASCMGDTPPVAIWALGLEIYCFVVNIPGYDFDQIQPKIVEALERHMEVLCENKMFPTRPYISGVHPLERIPIGINGQLSIKGLQHVIRNSTSTKPSNGGRAGPTIVATRSLSLSPSTLLKSEFNRSETHSGKQRLHSRRFLHRVQSIFSGLCK